MKLHIESMIYGGAGAGRDLSGAAESLIPVPFTLPDEIVEVKVENDVALKGAEIAAADLIAIEKSSSHRVVAPCPYFTACGGCQYQHATYEEQTRIKLKILQHTLENVGLHHLPAAQLHVGEPWNYRNRIRLRVALLEGSLRIGYNRRGSYNMLPIEQCPIAAPLLLHAAKTAVTLAESLPAWTRNLSEIELFTNAEQSKLQITWFLRSNRGIDLTAFAKQLQPLLPQLAGCGIVVVGESGRKEQPGATWGADGLIYRAAERNYWVSRSSFFQVNRFLLDTFVPLVTANQSGRLAWDLYAGVGLFSRALAESFTEVVGVETVVNDLASALKGNHQHAVGATVVEFLRSAVLQRDRPDLIVLDPPRAGVGAEVCDLLSRIQAPKMIYVSCDPATLARDLKAMVDSGYTVNALHLVDLFPQTFHMETVVVLIR